MTGASPAAASQLVEQLQRHGLVQRSEDPTDRRIKKVHLTDRGLELIGRGVTCNRFLMDLMAAMPPSQRETVHAAFGQLAGASRQAPCSSKRKDAHHK